MEVEEDTLPASGVTLSRGGEMTDAGLSERRIIDISGDSMETDSQSRPARRGSAAGRSRSGPPRALPHPPSQRTGMEWHVSEQGHKGQHASCRGCCHQFQTGQYRFCRSADARANASRYIHAACIPGGFHPQDTFTGAASVEQRALDLIACFQGSTADSQPVETLPSLPNIPATSGDSWWAALSWDAAFSITSGTLIDVPDSLKMAYALIKDEVIAHCLAAEPGGPTSSAWRKLSLMDSLLLNNCRPDGESQSQSVTRRLQQASDGDWHSLWLEAVLPSNSGKTKKPQSEAAQARLVRDLALAGEPARALRTLKKRLPTCRDPRRASDVQALFPPGSLPAISCPDEHKWAADNIDALAGAIASRLRKPNKRRAPGRLGGRLEHWAVLQHVEGGMERAGQLLARLALGLVPEEVIAAHAACEVAPTIKGDGHSLRPLQLGSVCRRVAMAGLAKIVRPEVESAVGADQLGIGAKDGCTKAYQALKMKCQLDG